MLDERYRPLMAEISKNIEQFEGTCYKASNWEPLVITKGFQCHRADYFQKHGSPQKLLDQESEPQSARTRSLPDYDQVITFQAVAKIQDK